MKKLLFLLLLTLVGSPVWATQYYVSSTGNDAGNGLSQSTAWKTIAKINTVDFNAGDILSFEGGSTFTGTITLASTDSGTLANPFIITSFGAGRALISAGVGLGIDAYNLTGVTIQNLIIFGTGSTGNVDGISFFQDALAGNEGITITNVDVRTFARYGISIGGWAATTGAYRHINIVDTISHDNGGNGVQIYAQFNYSNQDVNLLRVTAYNNTGDGTNGSGSGMVLSGTDGGSIRDSVAYENGATGTGAVGIWTYGSKNILFDNDTSHHNHSATIDGDGFDLDINSQTSTIQNCTSYNNDGAGYLLAQNADDTNHTGNQVLNNISTNDGQVRYGGIRFYGRITNATISGNSVSSTVGASPRGAVTFDNSSITTHYPHTITITSNTFTETGPDLVNMTTTVLTGATGISFQNNSYSGIPFAIVWGASTYSSCLAWHTATGQETCVNPPPSASIPPTINAWYSIPGTTLHNYCKSPEGTGGVLLDCFFVTPAWSSGAFDATNDFMYITGGGHNDYYGNDYFRVNINTLVADRVQGPTLPPAATGTNPDCIPDSNYGGQCFSNAKHTYDGLIWAEWLHKMVQIGGVPSPGGGFVRSIWLIDPVNHVETRLTDNYSTSGTGGTGKTRLIGAPSNVSDATVCTAADEANKIIYWVDQLDLHALDPVANTSRRMTNRSTGFSQYFTCEYDSDNKRVVLIGNGQFGTFDVSGGPNVDVPGSGDASFVSRTQSGSATTGASAPGIVYDPNLKKLVTWGSTTNINTIYFSDPFNNYAWTTVSTTGAQSPLITSANQGVYKRFRRSVKKRGVYVYCGDMTKNCLAIRLYAPDNSIVIKDTSGSTQTNRQVPIGRQFRAGDIPLCPAAWVNGAPVQTQTDVKNRWPDGSLKFGLVSFILPTLSANASQTVYFVNGSTCNNTGGLTQAQALAGGYDFDVTMTLVGGQTKKVSARAMLAAGKWRLWGTGPVMTDFIIEDRSAARQYDVDPNSDGARAFHPIFECRFFPINSKVNCSAILENDWISNTAANSTRDEVLSGYSITAGNASPAARAVNWAGDTSEDFSTHKFTGMSRTHKEFWVGTAPGSILIDHNLAYLASTGLIANFDPSFALNATYVTNIGAQWTGANKTIQGSFSGLQYIGSWQRNGADGGGSHPWVGLYPTWDIQYLYNPLNQTLYDKMYGNADLHGRLQIHMRELDSPAGRGQFYDKAYSSANTSTLGRPLSISARKGVATQDFSETCGGAIGTDKINFASTPTIEWNSYSPRYAPHHSPSVGYIAYLLSGRYFYLEELQMEGAYFIAWPLGCDTSYRHADQGYISPNSVEIRGLAWSIRSIAHAYSVSPDNSPEQAYFKWYFLQNTALLEGQTDTPISDTTHQNAWNFGHTVVRFADAGGYSGVSALGMFYRPIPDDAPPNNILRWDGAPVRNVQNCTTPGVVDCGNNPWMEGFLTVALNEGNDTGLNTSGLLRFRSQYYLCLTTSGVSNAHLDQYLMPGKVEEQYSALPAGQGWFLNWAKIGQYLQNVRTVFNPSGGSDQQYQYIALGSMGSFGSVSGVCGTDGATAYAAVRGQMQTQLGLIDRFRGATNPSDPDFDSPKWAMLPRSQVSSVPVVPPPPPLIPAVPGPPTMQILP